MTEETIKEILKFRDDRDWKQFHNPKDLAISISLEAAELLEVFQWSGADISNEGKQEKIREELADVVNYCVLMADACGLDLDEGERRKSGTVDAVAPCLQCHYMEWKLTGRKNREQETCDALPLGVYKDSGGRCHGCFYYP